MCASITTICMAAVLSSVAIHSFKKVDSGLWVFWKLDYGDEFGFYYRYPFTRASH